VGGGRQKEVGDRKWGRRKEEILLRGRSGKEEQVGGGEGGRGGEGGEGDGGVSVGVVEKGDMWSGRE